MLKRKVMLGATAGLLGAFSIAGAAFAQEGSVDGSNPRDSIKDRVAEILGIDREDLDTAMRTAREEHREAQQDERLAALVEAGTITQEQADELDSWEDAKPEVMSELEHFGKGLHPAMMPPASDLSVEARVAALVEKELITQEEADAIVAWVTDRPEWLDELKGELRAEREGRGHSHPHRHGRGSGHHGFRGFGQYEQDPSGEGAGTNFVLPNGDEINI